MRPMGKKVVVLMSGGAAPQWQTWQDGGVGLVGGTLPGAWGTPGGVGNNYTVLAIHAGFRQTCDITSITVSIVANPSGGTFKFKIFRYNGTTSLYDFVSEYPFTVSGTGTKTITLNPPVSVQKGDIPALYGPANHTFGWGLAGNEVPNFVRYDPAGGDITTSNAMATEASSKNVFVGCYSKRPSVVMLGDSMMSYNGASANWWYPTYAGATGVKRVPYGSVAGEVASYFGLSGLLWQSLNETGKTMAHVADSQIDEAIGACPKYIVVHAGTNDIATARSWDDYATNLATILSRITTETLLITDISPRTAFNDTQAATVRAWNASLVTWCNSNGVQLISTHDAMAQIRVSTGQLDDFVPAYTVDGTHFSVTAGTQKFADLIKPFIK